jgi:hypothetical protein
MKRWSLILAVACAAAVFPIVGCSDDDVASDDGGRDDARDAADADAAAADADADAADADADAADADADGDGETTDPCGPGNCPNDPTDGPIGTVCLEDTDCESGFTCEAETVAVYDGESYINNPGGYCDTWGFGAAGCDPNVADSCPTGSSCIYFGTSPTTGETAYGCMDSCSAASSTGTPWTNNCDCRDGFECSITAEVCFSGCSNNRECCEVWHDGEGGAADGVRQPAEVTLLTADQCTDTCDPCTYACTTNGCPGGDCAVGGPCEYDSACPAMNRCLDEFRYYQTAADGTRIPYFPGGMCIQDRCDLNGRECPVGSGCYNGGTATDPYYACYIPCNTGSEPGDTAYPCRDAGVVGEPDEGDYACNPVFDPAADWFDGTTEDGFCYPGNFTGGTTAIGDACLIDSDCVSPLGLGVCANSSAPAFCAVRCNANSGAAGVCGGADAGGVAVSTCFSGLCWESCDTAGGTLGANGCTQAGMACYPLTLFGTYTYVGPGQTKPAGICLPGCTSDTSCSDFWGIAGACNTTTGVCAIGK